MTSPKKCERTGCGQKTERSSWQIRGLNLACSDELSFGLIDNELFSFPIFFWNTPALSNQISDDLCQWLLKTSLFIRFKTQCALVNIFKSNPESKKKTFWPLLQILPFAFWPQMATIQNTIKLLKYTKTWNRKCNAICRYSPLIFFVNVGPSK